MIPSTSCVRLHEQAQKHKASEKKTRGEQKRLSSFCFWLEWIFGRSFILCRIYSKCEEQHYVRRRTFKCDSLFLLLVLSFEMEIMGNCLRQMCFVLLLLVFFCTDRANGVLFFQFAFTFHISEISRMFFEMSFTVMWMNKEIWISIFVCFISRCCCCFFISNGNEQNASNATKTIFQCKRRHTNFNVDVKSSTNYSK